MSPSPATTSPGPPTPPSPTPARGGSPETEVGDEESYYEVEVTLDDGSQVDVQLDRSFAVVGSEADREDGANDD